MLCQRDEGGGSDSEKLCWPYRYTKERSLVKQVNYVSPLVFSCIAYDGPASWTALYPCRALKYLWERNNDDLQRDSSQRASMSIIKVVRTPSNSGSGALGSEHVVVPG